MYTWDYFGQSLGFCSYYQQVVTATVANLSYFRSTDELKAIRGPNFRRGLTTI